MALVELKSNLASYRSEFTTPSVVSQTVNNLQQPSKPNINKSSNSNLDIDSTPSSYKLKTQFTNSFINSSLFERANKFISKYTGVTKFTQNVVNTSKYNRDRTPSKFSLQGIYNPSKFNINTVVNASEYNIDKTPSKFSPNTIYTPSKLYPEFNISPTTTRWQGSTAPAVNLFNDIKSGATGFSIKFTDPNQTKFIGATATSYTYPKLLGLSDRLVSRPLTNSKFPNTGTATLADQLPTGRVAGSVFHYAKDGVITTKKFSTKGYSESSKYSDNVKSIKEQSSKSLLFTRATEENSPSAIDQQYKKFNLRDESYNPTWNRQPFVLRGIQRKGKERPQYWGFGASKPGFDDGLIRGGIVTVADRVKADLDRIGSWMTSPKGLLWIAKQVGLGFTNPKVETAGLLVPRQTRIHTGVTSLLSVAGSPFGLHFTRHGIPFVNDISSYENVQKIKKRKFDASPSRSNRLIDLRNDLRLNIDKRRPSLINEGMQIPSLSGLGGPNSLYGIGYTDISRGSKSIKGGFDAYIERAQINPFTISRNYAGKKAGQTTAISSGYDGYERDGFIFFRPDLETISKNLFNLIKIFNGPGLIAKDYNYNPYDPNIPDKESINLIDRKTYSDSLYAGSLRAYTYHDFDVNKDEANITRTNLGETGLGSYSYDNAIESNTVRNTTYPGSPIGDINNYITLAYGKIPNKEDKSFKDFRARIAETGGEISEAELNQLGTGISDEYYRKSNLEDHYGFGNLGKVGADRLDPNRFAAKGTAFGKNERTIIVKNDKEFRGDKVTALDVSLKTGITTGEIYPADAKDLIKFYFQDGAVAQGSNYAVMAFRATMTGFTDSFSPGWDRIDIMGRPDGAYLYNSFERSISFNFTVAALSRSEMIPMWRKLNYLASYTMPDFNGNSKPSGPFMRITIGDLFHQTPGFITSLSYTIPDDATWDIADDHVDNKDSKQLPMVVEASVSFTIVGDYRPQMHGRVYSLSPGGTRNVVDGQWLSDAAPGTIGASSQQQQSKSKTTTKNKKEKGSVGLQNEKRKKDTPRIGLSKK